MGMQRKLKPIYIISLPHCLEALRHAFGIAVADGQG